MSEANPTTEFLFSSSVANGPIERLSYSGTKEPGSVVARRSLFERCYESFFSRLVDGLQKLHGVHGFDAEDVAQRAFEQLAKKLSETEIRNPEAYVWRVAQNQALSGRRSQMIRQQHASETLAGDVATEMNPLTPERTALAKETLARVNDALLAMDDRRRMVFLLCRIEGLNYTQIADRLGISRPAVAKHLTKAVAEIDAFLAKG